MTHERFLDLTLREVDELLQAETWRRRQDQSSVIAAAWHFALFNALAKGGKLDSLDTYLPAEEDQTLTAEESEKLFEYLANGLPPVRVH